MKQTLLSLVLLITVQLGYSQCDVVTSIDENFDGWTAIDECWETLTAGAMVYQDTDAITFYSMMSPNSPTMLATPEIAADTYTLQFDAAAITGGAIQIQVGTLTDNENSTTFTAIGSPIDLTTTFATFTMEVTLNEGEHLAFNAILPGAHTAATLDNVVLGQCLPVSSLDETFTAWTQIGDCWSTVTAGAMVYQDTDAITFYSMMSPNSPTILVSPKITAGTYTLEFDAATITDSAIQIQVGTLTDNENSTSFTALGDAIDLTATLSTFTMEVTLNEGEHVAFNAVLPGAHNAATLDNVVLSNTLSVESSLQENVTFQVYPNPSTDGIIHLSYNHAGAVQTGKTQVDVYTVTGRKVFESAFSNNQGLDNKSIDLSHLNQGVYALQFTSGSYTSTKKIILK